MILYVSIVQDWKWPGLGPPNGLVDVSGTVTCVALRQGAEPPESEVEALFGAEKTGEDAGEMGSSPGKNGDLMGFDVFLLGILVKLGVLMGF